LQKSLMWSPTDLGSTYAAPSCVLYLFYKLLKKTQNETSNITKPVW
jgi:hypothetical protein